MNCLDCEDFKSCDFIHALLDMIPSQCVDEHFNSIVRDHLKKHSLSEKGE